MKIMIIVMCFLAISCLESDNSGIKDEATNRSYNVRLSENIMSISGTSSVNIDCDEKLLKSQKMCVSKFYKVVFPENKDSIGLLITIGSNDQSYLKLTCTDIEISDDSTANCSASRGLDKDAAITLLISRLTTISQ